MDRYLKFADDLLPAVFTGEKTATIRYKFERAFPVGATVGIRGESGEGVGLCVIERVEKWTIQEVVEQDIDGHESYASIAECIEVMEQYYPYADIDGQTEVTVLWFSVVNK